MTVMVKYCGGCNPRFDRLAVAKQLQEQSPSVQIIPVGTSAADLVLVICGCKNKCVQHTDLWGNYGKIVLDSMPDITELYERCISVMR